MSVDWVAQAIPCVVTDPTGLIRKVNAEFVFDTKLCPYEVSVIIPDAVDAEVVTVASLDRYLLDYGIERAAGVGWAHVRPQLRNTVIDWQSSRTHHWCIHVPTEPLSRFIARTLEVLPYLSIPSDRDDATALAIPDDVVGMLEMVWGSSL